MLDAADTGGDGHPSNGRDLVDLELDLDPDLDLDAAYWQQLVSSPPPPFLVSPYPPLPPFWLFEDRFVESSSSLADFPMIVHCNSDTTNENITRDEGRMLQMPVENFNSSYVIKEKISKALRYFKESTDQHILVQLWAPVKTGDRYVLTTSGQPFALDPQSTRLLHYRTVSLPYMFSLGEDSDGHLGLPGRVFRQKSPEWTPNVQYYSSTEYQRLGHALQYDVQGSLALPVFEPSSESCVGVVEIILTSPKIHYGTEIEKVCKALEAVDLRTSEILDHPNVQICNEGRQAALGEILEILTVVCEALKLPLAQTWVPCMHHCVVAHGDVFKKSCMSTTDMAVYVVDPRMWGFRDACVEHHLQKGQGVAGRAFESHRPCFCGDITQFGKAEYPLVHYARMFGLAGCLVICLQSSQTGDDEYILEFFLPPECKDASGQKVLLDSISTMINQCFQGLKTVHGLGFKGGLSPETFNVLADESHVGEPKLVCDESYETYRRTFETYIGDGNNGLQDVGIAIPESREQHLVDDDGDTVDGSGPSSPVLGNKSSEILQRRRGKAEKSISLEVLQRYFCGSLKDAAKSLGVCPTTMKRICRQHGITRWPSRKISKVNRSLSKLKRVIESVHGAEGSFNLTSFACPIPAANCSTYPLPLTSDVSTHKKIVPRGKKSALKVTNREPKGSDCSKSVSSSNGSLDTPPQGSNQPSPFQEQRFGKYPLSPDICGLDKPVMSSMPESITPEDPVPLLHGMLVKDSGSSKDLRNLYNSAGEFELLQNERLQEPRAVTIKACYKEDIIRFRLPCVHACMVLLNDEVAKRLKLEVGTFTVKYLDDDRELVMLACDGDLEECIELAGSSGAQVIRLTVHDVSANLVSSCGSS